MIYMIMFQNGKALEVITHELSNPKKRKAYRKRETIIMFFFQAIILFYVSLNVVEFLLASHIIDGLKEYFVFLDYIYAGY